MANNNVWYKSWWFGAVVAIGIIFLILFAATKTTQFLNYQEYLKTEIDSLQNQSRRINQTIDRIEKKRDSIYIIRQRITIQEELTQLKKLAKEYEALKSVKPVVTDSITPEELQRYFIKELNR